MHDFVWADAHHVDYVPPSARVYCDHCEIQAVGYAASTEPADYEALEKELVARYTDDCDVAKDIVLIESVMTS